MRNDRSGRHRQPGIIILIGLAYLSVAISLMAWPCVSTCTGRRRPRSDRCHARAEDRGGVCAAPGKDALLFLTCRRRQGPVGRRLALHIFLAFILFRHSRYFLTRPRLVVDWHRSASTPGFSSRCRLVSALAPARPAQGLLHSGLPDYSRSFC